MKERLHICPICNKKIEKNPKSDRDIIKRNIKEPNSKGRLKIQIKIGIEDKNHS